MNFLMTGAFISIVILLLAYLAKKITSVSDQRPSKRRKYLEDEIKSGEDMIRTVTLQPKRNLGKDYFQR